MARHLCVSPCQRAASGIVDGRTTSGRGRRQAWAWITVLASGGRAPQTPLLGGTHPPNPPWTSARGLVWDVLREVVSARAAETGRTALDIVDVGGGTGGLAVPFASLGHNVTVVDPSPDALAAAQRRAAEAGARLAAVQGEAASLDSVAGAAAADLVICHNVLEYVDSPADAMAAIARVLRPRATVSVLASNAVAAVLHRALAGRFAEALRLLARQRARRRHRLLAGSRWPG